MYNSFASFTARNDIFLRKLFVMMRGILIHIYLVKDDSIDIGKNLR